MASAQDTVKTQALIIGAGLAGISTAVTLATAGIQTILIDKSSRLGGRAGSYHAQNGEYHPIGSHLFLGCCDSYISLLDTLGTRHLTTLQPRLRLAVADAGRSALLQAAPLPQPLSLVPSLARYPFLGWRDKASIALAAQALLRNHSAKKSESFATWLSNRQQNIRARRFLWELITAPTLNAPAEEASSELALRVFREAVFGHGQANSLGFMPADAAALLTPAVEYLRQRHGRVCMGNAVTAIFPAPNGNGMLACTKDGTHICADSVVIAIPCWGLRELLHPTWRQLPFFSRLSELPWHPIVDVFLVYDRPHFREAVTVIPGLPAMWLFPKPLSERRHQLALSISCPGDLALQRSDYIVEYAQERLAYALGTPLPGLLLDYQVRKHMRATFSAAPEHQDFRPPCNTPVPRLFLAGDYTDTGWPATMEGAVRSGVTAAKAVIGCLSGV